MTRLLTHEEKRLSDLLREAQHKPDEARLAALRQAILAQTPVAEAAPTRARFWRWALLGAGASLAIGLGVAFWPKAPLPTDAPPPMREAMRGHLPKMIGADYIKVLDDSQQAVFAWENMGYGTENPLLVEEEELL